MVDVIATTASQVCDTILATVRQALEACGAAPITTSYVAAGAIAWDDCCGLLVVAPERVFRSEQFPLEGTSTRCETFELVVDIMVLLLRCVPVVDDRGQAPTADALDGAYRSAIDDAAVIWNAVSGDLPEGWERANVNQMFVGAEGGCIGSETRLTIGLPQDEWCPQCTEVTT